MHKRLTAMRENLAACIEYQLQHLEDVDCEELGEAIDMLKDLEETLYFHAITEAMKGEGAYGDWPETKKNGYHQYDDSQMYYGGWNAPMMYYDGGRGSRGHSNYSNGNGHSDSSSYYHEPMMNYERDEREGRSPQNRRMYMEAKYTKDKATQLRELEKYMQELTSDMVEMIQDASPEEKQYLEKKISALASKIGQMK